MKNVSYLCSIIKTIEIMLEVNKKKKYILRPLTKTMRTKINSFETLRSKKLIIYGGRAYLDLKLKKQIMMTVVKKLRHGYIVYLYNYELAVGEFKFLPNSEINFIIKDSEFVNMSDSRIISNWRMFREYQEYIDNFTPIEVRYRDNLLKIQSLKNDMEKYTKQNDQWRLELELENKEIEKSIK